MELETIYVIGTIGMTAMAVAVIWFFNFYRRKMIEMNAAIEVLKKKNK
jgi:uncharacterized membrane protein YfbV (UPF0208 family)